MIKKDHHTHKFEGEYTRTVLIHQYNEKREPITTKGNDTIFYRKCKCGAEQSYDLERKIV